MINKYLFGFLAIFLSVNPTLFSSTTATAVITYTIGSIDAITVSGNPGPLAVTDADPGVEPIPDSDSSTTYAVTTNNSSMKIKAALVKQMPVGVSLMIELAAPTGATSAGPITMSTTASTLVSGITKTAQANLTITYTLAATAEAEQAIGAKNTVIYTISP